MRVLRHRATRHFVAILVGCGCGRKFLHRLDRPLVACLVCGRVANLSDLVTPRRSRKRSERHLTPRAARRSGAGGGRVVRRR